MLAAKGRDFSHSAGDCWFANIKMKKSISVSKLQGFFPITGIVSVMKVKHKNLIETLQLNFLQY